MRYGRPRTINSADACFIQPRFFTPGQRIPPSVILRYQDGVYATDYDGEREESKEDIILLPLVSLVLDCITPLTVSQGILLEKFLTLQPEQFKTFRKDHKGGDHPRLKDVHRYAKVTTHPCPRWEACSYPSSAWRLPHAVATGLCRR